jgi:hypothetical protein
MPTATDNMTASASTIEYFLNKQDRCDTGGCPAQAWVLVKFLTGELLFCSHHFDRFEAALIKDAYEVVDERHRINAKSESSA